MTAVPLNIFARRAVSQLVSIDPNGAAETMRRLNEQLQKKSDIADNYRLLWAQSRDECRGLEQQLAAANVEILDLRRHLQTLQTELQRFEGAL